VAEDCDSEIDQDAAALHAAGLRPLRTICIKNFFDLRKSAFETVQPAQSVEKIQQDGFDSARIV
jgi:hypothetical protein